MTNFSSLFVIQEDRDFWLSLSSRLQRLVRKWVYGASIPRWHWQEDDVIDDIIGETMARICERLKLASEGKAEPVESIFHFCKKIARNYFIDLVRKEPRVLCFSQLDFFREEEPAIRAGWTDLEAVATDALYQESLFNLLAEEINLFPRRQRLALLVDLAEHMDFDSIPSSLQLAFLRVNVQLKDYQAFLPVGEVRRRQFISLSYHAYKRLARLPSVKRFISSR